MLLEHQFTIDMPIEEAWVVFTDLPRMAGNFPGVQFTDGSGDTYNGNVRIKVGPIAAQYAGTAVFAERDDKNFRAVISASGRDVHGQGTAAATVTAQLSASGTGTVVALETDLAITGKVAQFGRGIIADVSQRLLDRFVLNLTESLLAQPGGEQRDTAASGAGASAGAASSEANELNLAAVVWLPILRRIGPPLLAMLATGVVVRFLSRRSDRHSMTGVAPRVE